MSKDPRYDDLFALCPPDAPTPPRLTANDVPYRQEDDEYDGPDFPDNPDKYDSPDDDPFVFDDEETESEVPDAPDVPERTGEPERDDGTTQLEFRGMLDEATLVNEIAAIFKVPASLLSSKRSLMDRWPPRIVVSQVAYGTQSAQVIDAATAEEVEGITEIVIRLSATTRLSRVHLRGTRVARPRTPDDWADQQTVVYEVRNLTVQAGAIL